MGVMDRDGDLEGTIPADSLGLQDALIARLRRGYGLSHDEIVERIYDELLAADRIEALTLERQERDRAAVNRVAEFRARLARAEECIEQVRLSRVAGHSNELVQILSRYDTAKEQGK